MLAKRCCRAVDARIGGFDPAAPLAGMMRDLTSFGSATFITLFALTGWIVLMASTATAMRCRWRWPRRQRGCGSDAQAPVCAARPMPAGADRWFSASFPSGTR